MPSIFIILLIGILSCQLLSILVVLSVRVLLILVLVGSPVLIIVMTSWSIVEGLGLLLAILNIPFGVLARRLALRWVVRLI